MNCILFAISFTVGFIAGSWVLFLLRPKLAAWWNELVKYQDD